AAGGTGGHLFPAEALAAALLARGERVVLMTDARAAGARGFAGLDQHVLPGAGIAGRGVWRAGLAAIALGWGGIKARRLLAGLDAQAVVGFGGYPSVAPALGARLTRPRPRLILHEQNAVLGRANRFLARFADVLALNFAATGRLPARPPRVAVVGNPVRPAITALHGEGYTPPGERAELLVLGGSLGAKVFSTLVPEALARLPAPLRARLRVTQQCRADDLPAARDIFAAAGIEAELSSFFNDVAVRLRRAQLVVSRAGASSVAEIAVAGRPAILIPLPGAIDDHQRANAEALAVRGAALRLDQAGLTPDILAERIETLLMNPEDLSNMAAAAAALGQPRAAAALADLVMERVPA
uniref:UDP-N-acetylglucosamine--N-acetylmuramyl- (pentapeptide) pyrophosphoryl-undecaprenol N-acetylglucosamine transferase n=1 Tax=Acidocella sp. TaxID=50710 RepID=UPI00260ACEB8